MGCYSAKNNDGDSSYCDNGAHVPDILKAIDNDSVNDIMTYYQNGFRFHHKFFNKSKTDVISFLTYALRINQNQSLKILRKEILTVDRGTLTESVEGNIVFRVLLENKDLLYSLVNTYKTEFICDISHVRNYW
jgi:hypothetical protein